jgi:HK97 family phage major capsid protein
VAIDTSAQHASIIRPEQVGPLVTQPVDRESIAVQVSTLVSTGAPDFRIPIVTDDVNAGWYAEAEEIGETSPATDELVVTPRKLAALTVISNELAQDSTPDAQAVVGQSIARDLARKLDTAFFGAAAGQAPPGLEDLTGHNTVDAGAGWSNLDPFAAAMYAADGEGRRLTAFVANSTDALTLSTLKDVDGSNRPLLGDPIEGTRRTILGVPLFVTPAVPPGTVWGIPRDVSMVVRRTDVNLVIDRSRYFERDSVGIRATMRVAFGWPHPAAVQRIVLAS